MTGVRVATAGTIIIQKDERQKRQSLL